MSIKLGRRAFLASCATIVGGTGLRTVADAASIEGQPFNSDSVRLQGRLPSELGQRSKFERPRRKILWPAHSGGSATPLQDLQGIITPADLHFERHHGGVPEIDPAEYKLLIHGMVERSTSFSLADLKRFPKVARPYFVECSGNGTLVKDVDDMPTDVSPQDVDGFLSTSEWSGVPLATLLREVGVKPGAKWLLIESSDAAAMARSIPIEKAWDDAMIAIGQNGEAIRPEQGYPARLLLPGWEGSSQVKWIRRIEVLDAPVMTREETAQYTDPLSNDTARIFSFTMDAKSIITFPAYPHSLPETGWWEISGLAWSGRGRIAGVDISIDGGKSWHSAELQGPVLPKCCCRFRLPWNWDGRESMLMSRATDETGYVQPTIQQLIATRGAGSHYHMNHIRPWKVQRTGEVFFGLRDLI